MLSGKPPQKTESKPLKAKVRKSVTITIRSSELWFVVQLSRLFTFGAPVNPLRRAVLTIPFFKKIAKEKHLLRFSASIWRYAGSVTGCTRSIIDGS